MQLMKAVVIIQVHECVGAYDILTVVILATSVVACRSSEPWLFWVSQHAAVNDGRGEKKVCECAVTGDDVAAESYYFVDVEALGAVCKRKSAYQCCWLLVVMCLYSVW